MTNRKGEPISRAGKVVRRSFHSLAIAAAVAAVVAGTTSHCRATDYVFDYNLASGRDWFSGGVTWGVWLDSFGNHVSSIPVAPADNVLLGGDANGVFSSCTYNTNYLVGQADIGSLVIDQNFQLVVDRGTLSAHSATIGRDGSGTLTFYAEDETLTVNIATDLSVGKTRGPTEASIWAMGGRVLTKHWALGETSS